MIRRRAASAGIATKVGNHSFRATGITAYLKNGGTLENRRRAAQDVGMGAACEADAMMLIWRCILLMADVVLTPTLTAQSSPPLALNTTTPLHGVAVYVHAAELDSAARQPGDPG